jgi:hypothetical protein
MHPSSTFHPPFIIKKLILSKRGGQREDERMIFSISRGDFGYYAVSLSRENGLFLETDNDLKCHNICCSIMPGVLDDGSG